MDDYDDEDFGDAPNSVFEYGLAVMFGVIALVVAVLCRSSAN